MVLSFWVCVFSPSLAGREKEAGPYVVFWNLENFFDPFDDSLTVDEEFTPAGDKHWTWKKFLAKRNLIAKALLSMHDSYGDWPLAVGFAEVENRMVLRQLTERTPLAKLGYGVVHRAGEAGLRGGAPGLSRQQGDRRGLHLPGGIYDRPGGGGQHSADREGAAYAGYPSCDGRASSAGRAAGYRAFYHQSLAFQVRRRGVLPSLPPGSLRYSPEGGGGSQGLRLRGAAACDCHRGFQRYTGLGAGDVAAEGDGPAQSGIVPASERGGDPQVQWPLGADRPFPHQPVPGGCPDGDIFSPSAA